MNCRCDSLTTLRDNVASFKREHLVPIAIDSKGWEGLYRCKACRTLFEETFGEDRFGGIPILRKVDREYAIGKWGIDPACATCGEWEEIRGFFSPREYERFLKYVDDWLKAADLTEIPVKTSYTGFQEQWFKCNQCNQIWRLVHPDFPFEGLWIRFVDEKQKDPSSR